MRLSHCGLSVGFHRDSLHNVINGRVNFVIYLVSMASCNLDDVCEDIVIAENVNVIC